MVSETHDTPDNDAITHLIGTFFFLNRDGLIIEAYLPNGSYNKCLWNCYASF